MAEIICYVVPVIRDKSNSLICTKLFIFQGHAIASAHGYDDYPLVEVFHPISNADTSALQSEAEKVLDDVLRLLLVET